MLIEQLDQLGEVGKRAGEAVDLVDHHDGDLAGPDIGQELLQGSAVEGGTREPAIVVAIRNQAPALMRLALDIGLAGFPLGIERVEFEVEIMLGRFAGVDRAALGLGNDRVHGLRSPSPTRGFCAAPAGCDLAARIRRRLLSGADDTLAALDEAVDSAPLRSPKKRGPCQLVPVMARASLFQRQPMLTLRSCSAMSQAFKLIPKFGRN